MLSKELLEALNEMNHEYFSAHAYMAGLIAIKNLMKVLLTSTLNKLKKNDSTVKIYDYINDRGEHAVLIQLKLLK